MRLTTRKFSQENSIRDVRLGSKYTSEFEHHFKKSHIPTEIQTIQELRNLHLNAIRCLI